MVGLCRAGHIYLFCYWSMIDTNYNFGQYLFCPFAHIRNAGQKVDWNRSKETPDLHPKFKLWGGQGGQRRLSVEAGSQYVCCLPLLVVARIELKSIAVTTSGATPTDAKDNTAAIHKSVTCR